MITAEQIIKKLDLRPLPEEGGYFRETYKDEVSVPAKQVEIESTSARHLSTAIYYLVTPDSFSALHRVKSDEIFHFYAGDSVEMIQIDEAGRLSQFSIGADFMNAEQPQVVVQKNHWQGMKLKEGGRWALMGTTVAPGFEYEDFEIGERAQLIEQFSHLKEQITNYTRLASVTPRLGLE